MYCIFKFLWVYSQFIHKILVNGYFYEMQNACNYLKLQELMILFQRHMQHKTVKLNLLPSFEGYSRIE